MTLPFWSLGKVMTLVLVEQILWANVRLRGEAVSTYSKVRKSGIEKTPSRKTWCFSVAPKGAAPRFSRADFVGEC